LTTCSGTKRRPGRPVPFGNVISADPARGCEHTSNNEGRPAAVVVSSEEWEAIEETIEVLQDEGLLGALRESEDDVEAGRLFSLGEVKRELGLA